MNHVMSWWAWSNHTTAVVTMALVWLVLLDRLWSE